MKNVSAWICVILIVFGMKTVSAFESGGIDIHGFISQGYLLSDKNNYLGKSGDGSFQFNEVGINFSKELTENLRLGIQFFSRDLGEIGNNEVEIDWAYGDYHWKDWFGFRVGILRQAHGFYNELRDLDMLRTSVLLPQSVYAESGRDLVGRDFISRIQGASIYGEIPMKAAGSLSYMLMIGGKNIGNDSAVAKWTQAAGTWTVSDIDSGTFYNGKLQWNTPLNGLRFGFTASKSTDIRLNLMTKAQTAMVNDISEYYSYVLSAEYSWKDLVISAEYMKHKKDSEIIGMAAPPHPVCPEAYYVSVSYRFTDWFEMGAYYSEFYYNEDDKNGENFKLIRMPDYLAWQKDFALSTRFDINKSLTFKLEGHVIDGATQLLRQENPDGFEKSWYLFAAKISFNF